FRRMRRCLCLRLQLVEHELAFAFALRHLHPSLRLWKFFVPESRVAERLTGINQGATDRVSKVVFRSRTMVHAVLAPSRRSALKRPQLSAQSVVIEKCGSP